MIKKKKSKGMNAFAKRLSAIREKQGKARLPKNHPPRPSGDGDHEYR